MTYPQVSADRCAQEAEFGGYRFRDAGLLRLALTHRSVGTPNNERLEFLGDAVLGLVMGELLYDRFPTFAEGELSRLRAHLVSGDTLARIALGLEVQQQLRLGKGERMAGGVRRTMLAGAMEAVLGAVWIDGGLEACRQCVRCWFADDIEVAVAAPATRDPKTRLQEHLQAKGEPLPLYTVVGTSGPDHAQCFEVTCSLSLLAEPVIGRGASRREAEKHAAARALQLILPEEHS